MLVPKNIDKHKGTCTVHQRVQVLFFFSVSDEDIDVHAIVKSRLKHLPASLIKNQLEGWIEDHFYRSLNWVIQNGEFVLDTTMVGVAMNGLSHIMGVASKSEFACALVRGFGGNLSVTSRTAFAKEVGLYKQWFILTILCCCRCSRGLMKYLLILNVSWTPILMVIRVDWQLINCRFV